MKKRQLSLRNGYWSKKFQGKVYYFGKDTGEKSYKAALKKWKEQEPRLKLGIDPEETTSGAQYRDLLNSFMENQTVKQKKGEIQMITLRAYERFCDRLSKLFPKTKLLNSFKRSDFDSLRSSLFQDLKGEDRSPKSTDRELGYARQIFKYAYMSDLVDKPMRYEEALKGVPKRLLRERRTERFNETPNILTGKEIKLCIDNADPQLKAMILLAINGGYNPSDLGFLKTELVRNLGDSLSYPRKKTAQPRVTPLWKETKEAIKEWLKIREAPPHEFLFYREGSLNPIFDENQRTRVQVYFQRLLKKLNIYAEGKTLAGLRSTFATFGAEVGDETSLKFLMGHVDNSMIRGNYVYGMHFPLLKEITDHIHDKIFNNGCI